MGLPKIRDALYEYSAWEHRDLAKLAYEEAIETWKRATQYNKKKKQWIIDNVAENNEAPRKKIPGRTSKRQSRLRQKSGALMKRFNVFLTQQDQEHDENSNGHHNDEDEDTKLEMYEKKERANGRTKNASEENSSVDAQIAATTTKMNLTKRRYMLAHLSPRRFIQLRVAHAGRKHLER